MEPILFHESFLVHLYCIQWSCKNCMSFRLSPNFQDWSIEELVIPGVQIHSIAIPDGNESLDLCLIYTLYLRYYKIVG